MCVCPGQHIPAEEIISCNRLSRNTHSPPAQSPQYTLDWVLIYSWVFFLALTATIGVGLIKHRASIEKPICRLFLSEPLILRAYRVWESILSRDPSPGTFFILTHASLIQFPISHVVPDHHYHVAEMQQEQEHAEEVRKLSQHNKALQNQIQGLIQKHEEDGRRRQQIHEAETAQHRAVCDNEFLQLSDENERLNAVNLNLNQQYGNIPNAVQTMARRWPSWSRSEINGSLAMKSRRSDRPSAGPMPRKRSSTPKTNTALRRSAWSRLERAARGLRRRPRRPGWQGVGTGEIRQSRRQRDVRPVAKLPSLNETRGSERSGGMSGGD